MKISIDSKYAWQQVIKEDLELWYVGSKTCVDRIVSVLERMEKTDLDLIRNCLLEGRGNFSVILRIGARVFAAVDKIRSYPVFYHHQEGKGTVSNSARLLQRECDLWDINHISFLEFRMAGYVTGRDTLYQGLYQLQSGEFLIWDGDLREFKRERYFVFFAESVREEKDSRLIDELDAITDGIFSGIMEESKGAPIWVALSGGFDSRLVLCKLKQLGYDNLYAFSYGPPGNYEAKAAKYVAEKVGVKWVFMPCLRKSAVRFFNSIDRKEYWNFSDNLCSLPFMQDIQTLWENRRKKLIPEGAVLINGNSGDFITGAHIPDFHNAGCNGDDALVNAIIEKHFSLWRSLKVPGNLEVVGRKISRLLKLENKVHVERQYLAKLWELWEWQERQSKFVVNGQRNYDFMGYRWYLPLWDDAYLVFWRDIGIVHKYRQALYRKYLMRHNWFGVFRNFPVVVWRWPGYLVGIVPIVRLIKAVLGEEFGERVYKMLAYWGHTRHLYAQYSYRFFLEHYRDLRRAHSLNVNKWIEDNGIRIS